MTSNSAYSAGGAGEGFVARLRAENPGMSDKEARTEILRRAMRAAMSLESLKAFVAENFDVHPEAYPDIWEVFHRNDVSESDSADCQCFLWPRITTNAEPRSSSPLAVIQEISSWVILAALQRSLDVTEEKVRAIAQK